eukprot:scaffold1282_cov251-Pinguiococcus_pyrenoidosus.AAC.2
MRLPCGPRARPLGLLTLRQFAANSVAAGLLAIPGGNKSRHRLGKEKAVSRAIFLRGCCPMVVKQKRQIKIRKLSY